MSSLRLRDGRIGRDRQIGDAEWRRRDEGGTPKLEDASFYRRAATRSLRRRLENSWDRRQRTACPART
jgi:hypothetical protein